MNGQDDNNVTFIDKGSVARIGENQDLESSGAFGFLSCAAPSPTLQDPCPNNTCYPAPYQLMTNNSFTFPENTPAISPLPLDSHHACDGLHVNNPFVLNKVVHIQLKPVSKNIEDYEVDFLCVM